MKNRKTVGLAELACKDLTASNGWLDPRGTFYPCSFTGHNDLVDALKRLIREEDWRDPDTGWIKISTGMFIGITVFVTFCPNVTGKQKVTLEKFAVKHKLISKDGDHISIINTGLILHREDGKLKWDRS